MRRLVSVLMLGALAACSHLGGSKADNEEQEYDVKARPQEDVAPPPFPKAASLVEFSADAATGNRFLIDADTLSLVADEMVRYVMVVRSSGGAENVSFEGISCLTRQQRNYAFGTRGGGWSPARDSQWLPIEARSGSAPRLVLAGDFFCGSNVRPRSLREILQLLRYGRR
jgi:CNP1-like family